MDPLHFAIAMGPLTAYLFLLGAVNIFRGPLLTTGARDTAVLGIAVSGLIVAGPMELFLPEAAAFRFGPWVWVLMLAFYFLCLTLLVLLGRPRLVVYNVTVEQLRPALADVVAQLDKEFRWAGDCLVLPQLGVQLHVEPLPLLRNVQLVASGPRQSYAGWRQLEVALADRLRETRSGSNPVGFVLVIVSVAVFATAMAWMARDQDAVAQALSEMLRR